MKRTVRLATAAAMLVLLAAAAPARANSVVTSTLQVRATVSPVCTIVAPSDISLGTIDVTQPVSAKTGTSTFTVKCTRQVTTTGTPYKIKMTSANAWKLALGGNSTTEQLPYKLTDDAGNDWMDGLIPTSAVFTGSKAGQSFTAKATLLAGTYDVAAGDYSDTVTVDVQM
jgi:spore coat protein U-like protein